MIVPIEDYLTCPAENLSRGWAARGHRRHLLLAALRRVLDFRTWRSLTHGGQMTRADAIDLATALADAATRGEP